MEATEPTTDVLVIGAGMAGLIAAAELQRSGRRVLVLDKSRGVGGRLASRRMGGASFAAVLEQGRQKGSIEEWCGGFSGCTEGEPLWRGNPGMSAVAKDLALGLHLYLEMQVLGLRRADDQWRAETTGGHSFDAAAVVLTSPVPQALVMLEAGGTVLPPELGRRLADIEYERCLAVLAVLEGASRLPPPGCARGQAPAPEARPDAGSTPGV